MKFVTAAALACAASAMAAVAGEAPLVLQGEGAYHTLRIPLSVRAQASHADLSDLRVLNAQGEAVPHAWVDSDRFGPMTAPHRQTVPLFKAPAAASAVEASQQGGWILDLRGVRGLPQELQLELAPGANGVYSFALEASADLQQWRTVVASAQLVSLQHQGQRLERSSFELPGAQNLQGVRGGYLRLRPLPGSPIAPLTRAHVASLTQVAEVPEWEWSDPIEAGVCDAEHCDYVLPRHLPLQRLEIVLTEPNTLARVNLLAQADGQVLLQWPQHSPHHHPVRDHLKALRHKTAPSAAAPSPVWEALPGGQVYALHLQGTELRSTVLALPGGLYTQLRVQPVGGMAQLGTKRPSIRVGAHAQDLVFLARGPAPYRLAWGQATPAVEMSLAQLMPGRQPDDPLLAASASLAPVAPMAVSAPASAASAVAAPPNVPTHKLWLWAALVAALGLMGFMAWSLLRPARAGSAGGSVPPSS